MMIYLGKWRAYKDDFGKFRAGPEGTTDSLDLSMATDRANDTRPAGLGIFATEPILGDDYLWLGADMDARLNDDARTRGLLFLATS